MDTKDSHLPSGTYLLEKLATTFLPVLNTDGTFPIVIGRSSLNELHVPNGITAERRKLNGPRIALRNPRSGHRVRQNTALWPEDGLQEARVPVIIMVAAGRADIKMADYILNCPTGTIIFVPPSIPYPSGAHPHLEGPHTSSGYCDLLWITPMGKGIDIWTCHSRGMEHHGSAGGEKQFLPNESIPRFLNAFQNEVEAERRPLDRVLQDLVRILYISICRDLRHLQATPQSKLSEAMEQNMPTDIDRARHYIHDHLNDSLQLNILARNVGMSCSHFTKRFKAETGQSAHQYIIDCRLERAKNLLRETNWTTRSIAQIVGMQSNHHFRQFFRRHMQITPLQYREQSTRPANPTDINA
jgi:AraC-like DNA-binding protein